MTELKFREAVQDDTDELVKLMLELGYKVKRNELSCRIKLIKSRGDKLIVAEKEGVIAGVVQALIDIRLAEGKVGEIVSLVVRDELRGKGIGKALIKQAKESLTTSGCTSIRVRANEIRKEAHEFYKDLGFIEKKTQKIFEKSNV